MIGIPLGMLAGNAIEWVVHKHVLHGLGRDRTSFWSFHWHEHHRKARLNDHVDDDYLDPGWSWNGQNRESAALLLAGVALAPLFPVAPFFVGTLWAWGMHYHRVHKRSHLDPDWARERLPWHYDHHMGPHQDANWCVTVPWFDWIMGTREVYHGTPREREDRARRQERLARRGRGAQGLHPAPALADTTA